MVGTVSIEKSEKLSKLLRQRGIKHEVLNAKHHERSELLHRPGDPGGNGRNQYGRPWSGHRTRWSPLTKQKRRGDGGRRLFVLGTERHESRRIDNQLRGRSAPRRSR